MSIDESGNLLGLPQILPGYKPEIGALAIFTLRYIIHSILYLSYRLGTEVEWDEEQECFDTFCRELAEFYCLHYQIDDDEDTTGFCFSICF